MKTIGLSEKASEAHPALASWLAGVGVRCVPVTVNTAPSREAVRILHVSERPAATVRDILTDFADGAPVFDRSADGQPALVRFGFEDMAFGHALIAELVRPAGQPACGEPESAHFLALASRIAASDATVLLLGQTGTGKEGISRFIHAASPRGDKPFIAINCAALPETMLEAMLFGHAKGAFTGAGTSSEGLFRAAEGGTLLLDEIAEMPLALQAKLLRALQEREVLPVGATRAIPVDVRIVAAGNRDLAIEVAEGRFRADLYWRLNVLPMTLKPLAERRLDIRAITAALLLRHSATLDFPWPTANALDRLMTHGWPGNVRELENVLQRALLLRAGDRIETDDLTIDTALQAEPVRLAVAPAAHDTVVTPLRLADASRDGAVRAIEEALTATGGHRARAAERLGISERTLRYRLAGLRAAAA